MVNAPRSGPERLKMIQRAVELNETGMTQARIAEEIGVAQSTICNWMYRHRPTVPQHIADEIRRELVCCNIYERMEAVYADRAAWNELRHSTDYHDICYFGEWAARIAEKAPKNRKQARR